MSTAETQVKRFRLFVEIHGEKQEVLGHDCFSQDDVDEYPIQKGWVVENWPAADVRTGIENVLYENSKVAQEL